MLTKILPLLSKYKLIILIILFFILGWFTVNHLRNQNYKLQKKLEIAEYNYTVSQDSLRVTKDKAGKDETNKLAYLTDKINSLINLNKDLAEEVKQIKGKVSNISKAEIQIVEKPVPFVVKGELIDSTVVARFRFDTVYSPGNFKKLSGYTKYDLKTGIATGVKETDTMGLKFVTGIKNLDKGKPEIFLKSNYPGFQVTSLEGAVLDPNFFKPKKKTPLITPVIAINWSPVSWNGKSQNLKITSDQFSIGIGVGFNILKLLGFKK